MLSAFVNGARPKQSLRCIFSSKIRCPFTSESDEISTTVSLVRCIFSPTIGVNCLRLKIFTCTCFFFLPFLTNSSFFFSNFTSLLLASWFLLTEFFKGQRFIVSTKVLAILSSVMPHSSIISSVFCLFFLRVLFWSNCSVSALSLLFLSIESVRVRRLFFFQFT